MLTGKNRWLWSAYRSLMEANPVLAEEITAKQWASIPAGVYLYTDTAGLDVYVGQTSRKGKRARSHLKKRDLRAGFGQHYQKHLRERKLPASDEQTKAAI